MELSHSTLHSHKEHGRVYSYPDSRDARAAAAEEEQVSGLTMADPAFVTLFPGLLNEILHKP